MSTASGLPGGLAFLPAWLGDGPEPAPLDGLLSGWVRANGWLSAGLSLPADAAPVTLVATPGAADRAAPPSELPEVQKSLRAGAATVVWQRPGTSGRLYTPLAPAGRPAGVVWAERHQAEPWTEADRAALRLAARLMERSPALADLLGAADSPQRLTQRLADAAVVCGRMAHDFDNVLTGILGFAELAAPLLPANSSQARYVGEIAKVGQRGVQFTQQLHQLSRSGQARPQPGSVSAALAREDARLRLGPQAGVPVLSAVPANLALVAMDTHPLGVVLGHLLDNAVQASPAGGRVVVAARGCDLSAADARGFLGRAAAGPHVEVTIQDAGPGVKPEMRPKLFHEPFVTTKAGRRGLGLAVVYRTLAAHAGGVRLDPGSPGTVARFVVPVAAARPPAAAPVPPQPALGADRP